MRAKLNDRFICNNPKILHGYYDCTYDRDKVLTVAKVGVPFITRMPGQSQTFIILDIEGEQSPKGHNKRFSVATSEFTKQNFTRV